MRRIDLVFSLGLFIFLGLSSCTNEVDNPVQVRIALSKGSPVDSYANYYNWIKSYDSTIICQELYDMPIDSALKLFKEFSGLILTGGTDINPALYQDSGDVNRCTTIDDKRDLLELRLIDSAMAWGTPVLGVCRGHQMLNVAFGGTLIIDIPTDYDTTVAHRCPDYTNCFHLVDIEEGSMLNEISGILDGLVNTNHHQGIKKLAPPLKICAYASDGLPEAVEWADPTGKSFLLGVQWHPERLDTANPLTAKILDRFIEECVKFESRSENN
jgi:putative glutamine amidotransferase